MKIKIYQYFLVLAGILQLSACSDSFLQVTPIAQDFESNYYKTAEQALNGLTAVYSCLGTETGYGTNWYCNKLGPLNSASDECYAGGGGASDMLSYQVMNNYTVSPASGPQTSFWNLDYTGVYRANLLLQKLEANQIPDLSADTKARYIGEAKALRAYYYFELVRLFKNIPLILTPVTPDKFYDILQAKPEDIYAQIEKDLNDAITVLPSVVPTTENGRITKGAAMAMLGKAIIYQNVESRMAEAASWLNKVNTSGVYSLLPNYQDIFDPANKYNKESIFEIGHSGSQKEGWGNSFFYGNVYVVMVGPRSYSPGTVTADAAHTYMSGWSFNPIIKAFAASIHSDPRYKYTVANLDSLVTTGQASYDGNAGYQNTGLFIQKYAPLAKWKSADGDPALNYPNDVIEIRLADTYLLEAEASVRANGGSVTSRAQDLLNAVRARVGLGSVTATLDNIYQERKLELATEGHRWFDLVRTGKAASVLAFKGFKAGKNEILPIPLEEMNNTKLVQNPGY